MRSLVFSLTLCFLFAAAAWAGPFTEAGVDQDDPRLVAWATGWLNYRPAEDLDPQWTNADQALGPATGDWMDTVALGERPAGSADAPGEITFTFAEPLRNRPGADLAVFENAFPAGEGVFGELGYVEVSSDGETWARFPSVSLTPAPVGRYGVIDPTDVYNLAGKFQNAYGVALGSPFDFDDLAGEAAVVDGAVDLDDIRFVKIVDIPGAGDYFDAADRLGYDAPHPIYDEHPTIGSAGFDVEAVGVMDESHALSDDDDDDDDDDNDDASPWRDDEASDGAGGDGSPGCV